MRMTDAQMYSRVLAGDSNYNGRFFTGVITTGIYCLPSCKARKPKAENVRFFPTCEAARAAGLRACRKCHPDDFARGADPVLESIETLVGELRENPADFPDVRAVVRRSGFGSTRVFELLRHYYHSTPADLLIDARIHRARARLLSTGDSLLDIAASVGFESQSVFHEHFRRLNGLTPAAYRSLAGATSFEIALPEAYPLAYLKRALSRDAQSLTERFQGDHYVTAVRLAGQPVLLHLKLGPTSIEVSTPLGTAEAAHRVVTGLIGLEQNASAFSRLAQRLGLKRLIDGRSELRVSQTTSLYDGLLWAIIGQQINLAFAFQLKRRLVERAGRAMGNSGLYALPEPRDVAALDPKELLPLQFSRQKADYLISISRRIASGELKLEELRGMSASRVERLLLAERGLGPWSVNYLMMRSLGFADCVPLGDTGVTSGLKALFRLEERPDIDATRRLMEVFSPYRSLATTHLWQFNKPEP